jgi:hypothetical protein
MNPLIKAVEFFPNIFAQPFSYTSVRSLVKDFDLSSFSKVYFGRRLLSEEAHVILVKDSDKASIPSYEGGVGFILLRDNLLDLRTLKCSSCKKEPLDPEAYVDHEDSDRSYVCSSCTPTTYYLEVIKK